MVNLTSVFDFSSLLYDLHDYAVSAEVNIEK